MRRYLWISLFALVLVTPFVLRWAVAVPAQAGAKSRPAPTGDALRLVVVTPHAESIRTEFAEAFSAWHAEHFGRPVLVDYRIYGGATDIARYFDSARDTLYKSTGTYQVDIAWGGGDDLFETKLRRPGHLQSVRLSNDVMRAAYAQPTLAGLALYDQQTPAADGPQWFGTALSSFGIVYNRDVLRHLGLREPRTWSDLADPRYRGWIILADPMRSSVARTSFMIMVERAMQDAAERGEPEDAGWARGMGLIRQVAANARAFTDSGTAVSGTVSTGEVAAGMTIDFHARSQVDAVQAGGSTRLGYVEPAGATAINPDPVAMIRGAENREVAVRFIEFLLGERGQRLWNTRAGAPGGPRRTSLRRLPIMKSLYANPANFTDAVNPYASSGNFNTSRQRTRTYNIIGELVQMSCTDLLDELRDARSAALASPRKVELDARLGTFPFDQAEALRRMDVWVKSTPLERLALQRQWTEEFRREYDRLHDEARK